MENQTGSGGSFPLEPDLTPSWNDIEDHHGLELDPESGDLVIGRVQSKAVSPTNEKNTHEISQNNPEFSTIDNQLSEMSDNDEGESETEKRKQPEIIANEEEETIIDDGTQSEISGNEYPNPNPWLAKMFASINSLRLTEKHCDFLIVARGNSTKHVHSLIMAAASRIVYEFIIEAPETDKNKQFEYHTPQIGGSTWDTLLDYIYTGHATVSTGKVGNVLRAAKRLEIGLTRSDLTITDDIAIDGPDSKIDDSIQHTVMNIKREPSVEHSVVQQRNFSTFSNSLGDEDDGSANANDLPPITKREIQGETAETEDGQDQYTKVHVIGSLAFKYTKGRTDVKRKSSKSKVKDKKLKKKKKTVSKKKKQKADVGFDYKLDLDMDSDYENESHIGKKTKGGKRKIKPDPDELYDNVDDPLDPDYELESQVKPIPFSKKKPGRKRKSQNPKHISDVEMNQDYQSDPEFDTTPSAKKKRGRPPGSREKGKYHKRKTLDMIDTWIVEDTGRNNVSVSEVGTGTNDNSASADPTGSDLVAASTVSNDIDDAFGNYADTFDNVTPLGDSRSNDADASQAASNNTSCQDDEEDTYEENKYVVMQTTPLCILCGEHFTSESLFREHSIEKHPDVDNKCPICLRWFFSQYQLTVHTKLCRKERYCGICGEDFGKHLDLLEHRKASHPSLPFKCIKCGERYPTRESARDHCISFHDRKQYSLMSAKERKEKYNKWQCPFCDFRNRNWIYMENHVWDKHKGYKNPNVYTTPQKCDVCGFIASSKDILRNHKKTHAVDKGHMCEICGKNFTRNHALQVHMASVHAKIKDWVCSVCGRGFADKKYLVQHVRLHTGEKPYVCDQCGASFSQKNSLNWHLYKHHSETGDNTSPYQPRKSKSNRRVNTERFESRNETEKFEARTEPERYEATQEAATMSAAYADANAALTAARPPAMMGMLNELQEHEAYSLPMGMNRYPAYFY